MGKVDSPTKQDFESMNLNGSFNHFQNKELSFWAILLQIKANLLTCLKGLKLLILNFAFRKLKLMDKYE